MERPAQPALRHFTDAIRATTGALSAQVTVILARKKDIIEIDKIEAELGLSKEQRRMLHDEIQGLGLSLEEIREIAKQIKELYPNK